MLTSIIELLLVRETGYKPKQTMKTFQIDVDIISAAALLNRWQVFLLRKSLV
jgi:hypothetical protein